MSLINELGKYIDKELEKSKSTKKPEKQLIKRGLAFDKKFTEKDADPEELKKGIKIELEHTTDKAMAKEIALDHLAEIPDYYTRLSKMEKDAEGSEEIDELSQINTEMGPLTYGIGPF